MAIATSVGNLRRLEDMIRDLRRQLEMGGNGFAERLELQRRIVDLQSQINGMRRRLSKRLPGESEEDLQSHINDLARKVRDMMENGMHGGKEGRERFAALREELEAARMRRKDDMNWDYEEERPPGRHGTRQEVHPIAEEAPLIEEGARPMAEGVIPIEEGARPKASGTRPMAAAGARLIAEGARSRAAEEPLTVEGVPLRIEERAHPKASGTRPRAEREPLRAAGARLIAARTCSRAEKEPLTVEGVPLRIERARPRLGAPLEDPVAPPRMPEAFPREREAFIEDPVAFFALGDLFGGPAAPRNSSSEARSDTHPVMPQRRDDDNDDERLT
jgi:hypothetical protein